MISDNLGVISQTAYPNVIPAGSVGAVKRPEQSLNCNYSEKNVPKRCDWPKAGV